MSAALINPQRSHEISHCHVRVQRHRTGDDPRSAPVYSYSPISVTPWPDATAYRSRPNRTRPDDRQAAYFFDLLTQHLRRINQRIGRCRAAITHSKVAGDIQNLEGFRRLLESEEHERHTVLELIANLQRRFGLPVEEGGY